MEPEISSKDIIAKEPSRRVGLRPHLSIHMIAGIVIKTLIMY